MNITITQSQAILIKNSLNMMRSYIKEVYPTQLSTYKEYKEIDNILDKLEEETNNDI